MRRLSKKEISGLVVAAVIGVANVHAAEPGALDEIVVTSNRIPPPVITISFDGPINSDPQVLGSTATINSYSTSAQRAWSCAQAYAGSNGPPGTPGSLAGPAAGWSTYFTNNYLWANDDIGLAAMAPTSTPPFNSGNWTSADGYTSNPVLGNPYVVGYSIISMPNAFVAGAHTAMANLIDTLAHEWSHQQGASDDADSLPAYNANTIGDAVRAAYEKDKGAKCGGL